ncbi:hypothetical protein [Nitrogeniibacter aestuarii]|uniref:hypothetical protein n=1 Tax=Nitrogeniibacter aestuarii TaxID=2815343 RepID=UPI001D109B3F|nr:hypothetical protein [Nitrogeniibacter aestuarii]
MTDKTIKGTFKGTPFKATRTADFAARLAAAGIDVTVEWKRNHKPAKSPESANSATFNVDGTPILTQVGAAGNFTTEPLDPTQTDTFISLLKEEDIVQEPNGALALILVGVYCVLHVALFGWRLNSFNPDEVILFLHGVGVLCALIGLIMMHARELPDEGRASLVVPGIFAIPGFILTVPSALLLLPAYLYAGRRHAYDVIHQYGEVPDADATATA